VVLFVAWRIHRHAANHHKDLLGSARSGDRADVRKLEAGSWKLEAGSWKLEAGSWKLEAGSWKLEAGSWKLEAGS